MKVKVIGTKRMTGVSKKTDKPYDSIVVAYTREVIGFTGLSAGEIWIPIEHFGDRLPELGDTLMISRDGPYIDEVYYANE